jgi:CheY-like chemotaxis protein
VVEDNLVNQKLVVHMLQKRGHLVEYVNNGKEALAALEEGSFDLVLMDIQMPEMDGLEATKAICQKEKETDKHIPIIAMTAHAMKGDRERCLEAGMDNYVSKPIRTEELFEVIEGPLTTDVEAERKAETAGEQIISEIDNQTPKRLEREEVFDEAEALTRAGSDRKLFKEVVELFIRDSKKQLTQIYKFIENRDNKRLERAAHTLKGSVDVFAAKKAFQASLKLEKIAHMGDMVHAKEVYTILENEIDCLNSALTVYIKEKTAEC